MTDTVLKSQAFKLKGRLYTFTVMQIVQSDVSAIAQQLADVIAKAPRLFINTPVVLDCSSISSETIDIQAICQCLRGFQLVPVAIQGGSPQLNTMAQCHGLGLLNASAAQDKPLMDRAPEVEATAPTGESLRAKLFATPVRSGQQVVSKGRDLVVMASVSHGAELMSDGHIHVYGTLRGRALAGMMGDTEARIFCSSLEAELVSIAGYYLLCDTMTYVKGPCQIYLKDDQIQIESL